MEERRARERLARREGILAAARRLLAERPYGAVRVEDIAAEAELAKGTLYQYFADKDEIAAALGGELFGWLLAVAEAGLAQVRAGVRPALAGLEAFLESVWAGYARDPVLFRLLVLDRPELLAALSAPAERGGARLLEAVEDFVREAQARGEAGPVDPQVVSHGLWALVVGGLVIAGRGCVDEEDLRRHAWSCAAAFVDGLCRRDAGSGVARGTAGVG